MRTMVTAEDIASMALVLRAYESAP